MMDQRPALEMVAPGLAPERLRQTGATLGELEATLGRLTATADQDFLKIGATLGHSVEVFGRLGGSLSGLAEQLHSHDAGSAVAALEQVADGIGRMSGGDGRIDSLLGRLEEGAGGVTTRLGLLGRIIGEIGALAINGKIQAALVTATGVDFSVFTTEIGRLGQLAAATTEKAAGRLTEVRAAVASARQASADFERNEAKELEAVRSRIQSSLSVLAERRKRAAMAADSVAAKSRDIAQRIASTVGELQINDSVCQRVEHIREVLRAVGALAAGRPVDEPGCQWLNDVPGDRRGSLIGGVSHLLSAQLGGAASDYRTEVEGLIRNLKALAVDAGDILSEAEAAFGGSGGGLFVAEIEQDVRRATELLGVYANARERADSVVVAVSDGFRAMAADLAAIQSIDADMRVMGLNATLKCSRLGNDGRALGVVAHELRACSKRTEDCTHGIAELLKSVLALADTLAAASVEDEEGGARDPIKIMADSLLALSAMGESMADALAALRSDASQVSSALTETAAGIDIHHRVGTVAKDGSGRLAGMAADLVAEADLDEAAHRDIHRLMQGRYTMDRERIVHQIFAKDDSAATSSQVTGSSEDDLEGMFL